MTDVVRAQPLSATDSRALARAGFLAEASRLLGESLDYEATLQTVARLAIPELGGWCIVDLVEDDGSIRRIAVIHPDPDKQSLARELESRYPPLMEDPVGAPAALRTGRAEIVPEVTDTMLVAAAHDERHLEILRALGMGSFVVAPMEARGHVVGCITFISASDERRYDEDDLLLASDLAGRSALAVDNALLFRAAERARAEAVAAQEQADRRREEAVELGLQAQESERAKTDFLSIMSHELRTPINAVVGYADLILAGVAGEVNGEQRRYLERLRLASDHLLNLVNDVLDVVKADANRLLVTRQVADARAAVRGALVVVQPHAAMRGVRLIVRWPALAGAARGSDAGLQFVGDPRRVEQVLINLITNAIKFTPRGGEIEVAFERHAGPPAGVAATELAEESDAAQWIGIRVRDTGPGIPYDEQARVFEPFVQLDTSKTRESGGSGLGLAISRRLARRMDGEITLESAPGEGSTFTLWLRAPGADQQQAGGASAADGTAELPTSGGAAVATAGERRGPERQAQGLFEIGDALQREVGEIVSRYVMRVRDDDLIPAAHGAPWTEIANHTATLLTDIAQSLAVVEEAAGGPAPLMRIGDDIRQVVAERHGQRRALLGWTEVGLERDFDLLNEEVEAGVRRALPDSPGFALDAGFGILRKLLDNARTAGRDALRRELAPKT